MQTFPPDLPTSQVSDKIQQALAEGYGADLADLEVQTTWVPSEPCPPRRWAEPESCWNSQQFTIHGGDSRVCLRLSTEAGSWAEPPRDLGGADQPLWSTSNRRNPALAGEHRPPCVRRVQYGHQIRSVRTADLAPWDLLRCPIRGQLAGTRQRAHSRSGGAIARGRLCRPGTHAELLEDLCGRPGQRFHHSARGIDNPARRLWLHRPAELNVKTEEVHRSSGEPR